MEGKTDRQTSFSMSYVNCCSKKTGMLCLEQYDNRPAAMLLIARWQDLRLTWSTETEASSGCWIQYWDDWGWIFVTSWLSHTQPLASLSNGLLSHLQSDWDGSWQFLLSAQKLVHELLQDFLHSIRMESTIHEPSLEEVHLRGGHHVHTICGYYKVALCQFNCFQVYHTEEKYAWSA